MSQPMTIPVVDLRDFRSGSQARRQRFTDEVGRALVETGFFILCGYDVAPQLIKGAYDVALEFFDLPEEIKKKYEVVGGMGQRGFTSFGREHAKNQAVPDLKEFWHVGQEFPPGHPLIGEYPANVWPVELRGFRPAMSKLFDQLNICAMDLLDACSLYLGRRPEFLRDTAVDGNSILRVINYPPVPADANPASIRAAAHEDINLITLLCEATAPGLELLCKDGSWLPITAEKDQIIVDAGDMMQNLTNGLFKSTTHRVTNPESSRERRFSMPFFVHPRSEVSLKPLPDMLTITGGTALYPDITAGEYLDKRLREIGLAKK